MPGSHGGAGHKLGSPAVYRITVAGDISPGRSDRLSGMRAEADGSHGADLAHTTVLVGKLVDQAQLIGVINTLYEMRLPLVAVEILREGDWEPLQIEERRGKCHEE